MNMRPKTFLSRSIVRHSYNMSTTPNIQLSLNECESTSLRPTSEVQLSNGVKNSVVQYFPATSGQNATSMSFNVNVPQNHFLHSEVQITVPAKITVTNKCTNDAVNRTPLVERLWGFSHMSFYHLIESMSININGQNITKRLADVIPHLVHYEDMSSNNPKLSDQYSTPDWQQSFTSFLDTNAINNQLGSSPFAKFGDVAYAKYLPRTTLRSAIVGNTPAAAGVDKTSSATLFVDFMLTLPFSLFSYAGQTVGISQIQTLEISLNLNTQYDKLISRTAEDGNVISAVGFEVEKAPQLAATFHLPSDFVIEGLKDSATGRWAPQTIALAEHSVYYGSEEMPIAATGTATAEMSTASIGLSSIPKRIFVCAMRQRREGTKDGDSMMTYDTVTRTPCVYGQLENLKIAFSGQNAAGYMNPYELYSQSARNGLSIPWAAAKQAGFVACFDLSAGDLGIQDAKLVGMRATIPLQVTASVRNLDSVKHSFKLVVIVESESYLTIDNGQASLTNAIDIQDAQKKELLQVGTERIRSSAQVIGGSFLASIFKWGKKIIPALVKHVPAFLDTVNKGSGVAPNTIGGNAVLGPKGLQVGAAGKKGSGIDASLSANVPKSRIL